MLFDSDPIPKIGYELCKENHKPASRKRLGEFFIVQRNTTKYSDIHLMVRSKSCTLLYC